MYIFKAIRNKWDIVNIKTLSLYYDQHLRPFEVSFYLNSRNYFCSHVPVNLVFKSLINASDNASYDALLKNTINNF